MTKQSKNQNKRKLTVLLDNDIRLQIKKEVLDIDCTIGEFIEKLFKAYKKAKGK